MKKTLKKSLSPLIKGIPIHCCIHSHQKHLGRDIKDFQLVNNLPTQFDWYPLLEQLLGYLGCSSKSMQTSQHNSATDKRFLPFLTWVQQKDVHDMWIKGVLVVWRWASSTAVTLPKQSRESKPFYCWTPKESVFHVFLGILKLKTLLMK